MDEYQNKRHYVYFHIDPETQGIVYVGHGSKSRAWTHGYVGIFHSKEHAEFLSDLLKKGYLPDDWVVIYKRHLSKKEACRIEQSLIQKHNTIYNKPQGQHLLKVSEKDLQYLRTLRDQGLSYSDIGKVSKFSRMTCYRALTGRTKNLKGADIYG